METRKSVTNETEEIIRKKIKRVRKKFINCADANDNRFLNILIIFNYYDYLI